MDDRHGKVRQMAKGKMVSTEVLEEIFEIRCGTWDNWRSKRQGPPFYKAGAKVLYDPQEVENWIRDHRTLTVDSLS
jgi:hypothetical protein